MKAKSKLPDSPSDNSLSANDKQLRSGKSNPTGADDIAEELKICTVLRKEMSHLKNIPYRMP